MNSSDFFLSFFITGSQKAAEHGIHFNRKKIKIVVIFNFKNLICRNSRNDKIIIKTANRLN